MLVKAEPVVMYQGRRVVIREFDEWAKGSETPRTFKEARDRWDVPFKLIADLSDALGFDLLLVNAPLNFVSKPRVIKKAKKAGKKEVSVRAEVGFTAESLILATDAHRQQIDEKGASDYNVAQDEDSQENR